MLQNKYIPYSSITVNYKTSVLLKYKKAIEIFDTYEEACRFYKKWIGEQEEDLQNTLTKFACILYAKFIYETDIPTFDADGELLECEFGYKIDVKNNCKILPLV